MFINIIITSDYDNAILVYLNEILGGKCLIVLCGKMVGM